MSDKTKVAKPTPSHRAQCPYDLSAGRSLVSLVRESIKREGEAWAKRRAYLEQQGGGR